MIKTNKLKSIIKELQNTNGFDQYIIKHLNLLDLKDNGDVEWSAHPRLCRPLHMSCWPGSIWRSPHECRDTIGTACSMSLTKLAPCSVAPD